MHSVLVRPVITERSMNDAEKGKFTFIVAMGASKDAIKLDVEKQFKVHVTDIATTVVKGKKQRVGKRRTEQAMSVVKKAVVKVKSGEKIDLFDLGAKNK